MALNTSFVEDTDEDFFDNLVVDDDDDYKPPTLCSKEESNVVDGKAIGSLSVSDVGTGLEDLGKVGIGKEESASIAHREPDHLVSSNLVTSNGVNEVGDNGTIPLEQPLDSTESEDQNHGIGGTAGVKEVQWSDFGSGSLENSHDGFGSYPDFFNDFGDGSVDQTGKEDNFVNSESNSVVDNSPEVKNVNDYSQQVESNQASGITGGQEADSQDPSSSQYWENVYPGWRYDANTGQWYQVDESYNKASYAQGANNTDSASDWTASNQKSEVSYLQQSALSVVGSVAETGKTESVTNWNLGAQSSRNNDSLSNWNKGSQDANKVYPSHMVFDPQYPGWYYDLNAQEWRSLDDYNSQSTAVAQDQVNQNGFGPSNTYNENDQKTYSGQEQDYNWNGSFSNAEHGSTTWQPNVVANSAPIQDFRNNQVANQYGSSFHVDNRVNQQQSYEYAGTTAHSNNGFPALSESESFVTYSQSFGQPLEQTEAMNIQKAYGNQNQLSYMQQPVQSGHQISYASSAGRSSAGRPPHALVTFGFGGKLIVMKDSTALINSSYGSQDSNSGSISVLSLAEVVTGGAGVHDYFHTLCQHSFPGPLSGGNVGSKELNRWIDDRITHSETSDVDHNKVGALRLLLSLLKIALQHYGKLRSSFGSDPGLKVKQQTLILEDLSLSLPATTIGIAAEFAVC